MNIEQRISILEKRIGISEGEMVFGRGESPSVPGLDKRKFDPEFMIRLKCSNKVSSLVKELLPSLQLQQRFSCYMEQRSPSTWHIMFNSKDQNKEDLKKKIKSFLIQSISDEINLV